jgi:AcrR family transcriptional regulator
MVEKVSRRAYRSPRREAAARATRRAVLEAADSLFISLGYTGTTLAAVAERADVSLATVKTVAPTKSALLLEVGRSRARGDTNAQTLSQRSWWREMLSLKDPAELLRRWVSASRSAHERQAALFEVVWQAAPAEPEIADLERRGSADRREDFRGVIEALAALGGLRSDLDIDAAVDIAWVLNSPLVYRLFARCGWSPDQWEIWIAETLELQLLAPSRGPSRQRRRGDRRST